MVDFARFFQLSLEMLATADATGHFVDLNPAWTRVLGYSLEELKARPFVEFVHPDDREKTNAEAATLLSGNQTVSFENRYLHKDGEYRHIMWTALGLSGEGLIYACARDITAIKNVLAERERALEQALEYEAEFRRVEDELRRRVEAQQDAIHMMSTPIIQVWDDIVTLPVIGLVDSVRAADMKNALLETVSRTGARFAIVDLTGVDTVDTATADHLLKVMRAVGLLGASCVMTGIQPAVAQIMVTLGLDMQSVITLRSLREGLKYCMRKMGIKVTRPAPQANPILPTGEPGSNGAT